MLLTTFISKLLRHSRATSVQDKFRESQDSYLEFLRIAERRALEVSPNYKLAWQNAFRLQHLLMKQRCFRFEYLLGNGQMDTLTATSISSLTERLDKGWTDTEEFTLKNDLPSYREISREIDEIKSKWDPSALDEPRVALEQDSEYRKARLALSERAKRQLGA
jgi:hypothetical protein